VWLESNGDSPGLSVACALPGRTALLTADAVGKTSSALHRKRFSTLNLKRAVRCWILLIPALGEERRRATTAFAN
jgi:hypothetical protein